MKEPTPEQCTNEERVFTDEGKVGFALWYPQMGGYIGKAIAIFDAKWEELPNGGRRGGCVDVYVWHDGEFPFVGEDGREPVTLHHCDGEQFIQFGETLCRLNEKGRAKLDEEKRG